MSHLRPNQDAIGQDVVHLWAFAKKLDADAAWIEWWKPAGIRRLELRPSAAPVQRLYMEQHGDRLVVDASDPYYWHSIVKFEATIHLPDDDDISSIRWPEEALTTVTELCYRMLDAVAADLELGPTPAPLSD